ncbi:MAG: HAD-IA family hydrolase [Siphonobacter sp.]
MIKYVLFDFDGTLVDSKNILVQVFNDLSTKYAYPKVSSEICPKVLSIAEHCKALGVPFYRIPFLSFEFLGKYRKSVPRLTLFDGLKNVLTELSKRGYLITILSSHSKRTIQSFLKANQLTNIHTLHSSQSIFGKEKILGKFLKKNRLKSSEVIYIGDEVRDIIACHTYGIKVAWVSWGYDTYELIQPQSPDFIIHSPDEILQILQAQ